MPQSPGHLNCFCLSYQLLLSIFFSPTLAFAFLPSSDPPSLLSFLPFFLSTQNIAHHNGSGAAVVTDLASFALLSSCWEACLLSMHLNHTQASFSQPCYKPASDLVCEWESLSRSHTEFVSVKAVIETQFFSSEEHFPTLVFSKFIWNVCMYVCIYGVLFKNDWVSP